VSIPTFEERAKSWSSPPVDDVGYIPAEDLLAMGANEFDETIRRMWKARYQGWRNFESRWVETLGLMATEGKTILDYGCGVGLEGAILSTFGNHVVVADVSEANLAVARRTFRLYETPIAGTVLIREEPPFITVPMPEFDVIHCNGVLHHIPEPVPVVEQMAKWLKPGGELRLMVYSDQAWRIATGLPLPTRPVEHHAAGVQFWQHWDAVGGYADWYDEGRLTERFGRWFEIRECRYLTQDSAYLGAVLVKR
jgi:SAM-dependent methyltransferase